MASAADTRPQSIATSRRGAGERSNFRKGVDDISAREMGEGADFHNLDYTPCIVARPIDLDLHGRMRRSRGIRIIINITMYNEPGEELKRTLVGLAENMSDLEAVGVSWEQVLITILVDGRNKANPSLLSYCEKLHIFDPEMMRDEFNGSAVTMHLFERSVRLPKHETQREYYKPMQLVFALKEKNGGKLNSHLWFFTGFCRQLNPKYTFLLDVGTQPRTKAISKLFMAMEENPQIGGVAGEIAVREPKIYNMLEAAQHFEYKISHVLDKAMESVFGYISVLPGAFSAYRYEAIQGSPLNHYFFVEENSVKDMGPFMSNMYLAEDRVLCFELVAKRNSDWTLHYEAGAIADTDVPGTILELIKQRRRWLNGAFFSLIYYVSKFFRITKDSAHSWPRKFMFWIQFLYQLSTLILNWFTVGTLYLSFSIVFFMSFSAFPSVERELIYTFNIAYMFLTILQFLLGLGGKANNTHRMYWVCCLIYGLIMYLALLLSLYHLATQNPSIFVVIAALVAFGSYAVGALLHGELVTIMMVLPQYLFMLPTFVNMFIIYSFCNMHDISWGTKEGNLTNETKRQKNKAQASQLSKIAMAAAAKETNTERLMRVLGRERAMEALKASRDTDVDLLTVAAQLQEQANQREADAKLKQDTARENVELEAEFSAFRTRLVTAWCFSNWLWVTLVITFQYERIVAIGIVAAILWTLAYRVTGSLLYVGHRCLKACCRAMCRALCRCCCGRTPSRVHGAGKRKKGKYDVEALGRQATVNAFATTARRGKTATKLTDVDERWAKGNETSRKPSRQGRKAQEISLIDLSDELADATKAAGAILDRDADGSRPASNRSRRSRVRTARSTRSGHRSRPRSAVSHSDSDSDSGSSDSGSSSGSSSSGSDSDTAPARVATGRSRMRTPGRTVSRSATSNAPLSSSAGRRQHNAARTRSDASSEDADSPAMSRKNSLSNLDL